MLKRRGKTNLGFSLVELLIVLTITGLLCSASIALAERFNRLSLLHITEKLTTKFINYHLLASQREDDLKTVFNEEGYKVYHKGTNDVLDEFKYPKYVSITFNSTEEDIIYFYASGVVSPTTFYVSRKGDVCKIVMSMRGRIRNLCHKQTE